MGNRRSGWHGSRGGRATTDSAKRITIAGILGWQRQQGIGLHVVSDTLWSVVHARLEHPVEIIHTRHYPAGVRRYFRCGMCNGRCSVLFIRGSVIACRTCHNLAYPSQMLSYSQRKLKTELVSQWREESTTLN